jgi:hypothetical protein
MWLGRVPPIPGNIAIYNRDGNEADHIGIVSRYLGNDEFEAIEGNTSIGRDSDGGEVMRRAQPEAGDSAGSPDELQATPVCRATVQWPSRAARHVGFIVGGRVQAFIRHTAAGTVAS